VPEIVVFNSISESSSMYLQQLGIPSKKIITLSSEYYDYNKTLSNARSFAKWYKNSEFRNDTIMLFSFDIHSRRSYITFKHELEKKTELGIIASPSLVYTDKDWWKSKKGRRLFIDELGSYIYVILISMF
jgi:hypothetical protein